MKIEHLNKISSTQIYLTNLVRSNKISENLAVLTDIQDSGVGSRGDSWIGESGNLFFSIAILKKDIPKDIPTQSLSIYFSIIMKDILVCENMELFLKWPNDFYISKKKVGGTITAVVKDFIIIGIGINMFQSESFGTLKTSLSNIEILKKYISEIEKFPSWKTIFKSYLSDFEKSRDFLVSGDNEKISLKLAKLNFDGSINLNGKIVFSLR